MRPRFLVGHAPAPGRAFEYRVLLQSVTLALRTGFLVRRHFLPGFRKASLLPAPTPKRRKMDQDLIRRKRP